MVSPQEGEILESEPPVRIALQIVAKPLQIAEWLLWTTSMNSETPYPMAPPPIPYHFPFPRNNMFIAIAMPPSAKWLALVLHVTTA